MDSDSERVKTLRLKAVELSKGEAYGLSALEIKCANDYLQAHPDATVAEINHTDSHKMIQLISLGATLTEIGLSFPKYELGLIVVVAARSGWIRLKDKNRATVQADIQTKVLKASLDSMDFLTAMISATSQKYSKEFREYMSNPDKEFPDLKVSTVKDFKDLLETMQKMVIFTVQAGTDDMIREKTEMPSINSIRSSKREVTPISGTKAPVKSVSAMLAEKKKESGKTSGSDAIDVTNRSVVPIESTVDSSHEVGPSIDEYDLVKMPALDLGTYGEEKDG
jgi:hypothetical protein